MTVETTPKEELFHLTDKTTDVTGTDLGTAIRVYGYRVGNSRSR